VNNPQMPQQTNVNPTNQVGNQGMNALSPVNQTLNPVPSPSLVFFSFY